MNKEAAMKELTGQTVKLTEQYRRREQILSNIEKEKAELEEIKLEVKNLDGIIQTLQFMIQTDGFANMQGLETQPVTKSPTRSPSQPVRTSGDAVSKALVGG